MSSELEKLRKRVEELEHLQKKQLHTDLTEVQKKLHDSEERMKVLFESAPDAIYLHDLKGNFVDGNKAAEKMTGYSRDELIGKNFTKLNLLPGKYLSKAASKLLKNIQGKEVGPDEFELIHRDGHRISVEIRAFPIKIQNKKLVMGIVRDISARKKAEEELRESEAKFRSIFENAALGIFRSTPEGIYQDVKMPGMDGYEATRKIREFNKDVVIIAQTAFAMEGDREKAIQVGCDDYIPKPINKEKLLEIIAKKFA